MNSVLKVNVRRVSALLAGFAMAATIAGLTVAGTASAAPAVAQTETTATATGEYTAQSGTYYGSFRTSTLCGEKARWVEANGTAVTDAWCLQGNATGTIWHLYYEGRL